MDSDAMNVIGRGMFPSRPLQVAPADTADTGQFARVFDLADARRKRMTGPDRIPDSLWDDMDRAGELAEDLAARGQQVRFDTHLLSGRVVASLCDQQGRVMRPVALTEVLGRGYEPDPDHDPAAAA